ncbi:MAG TPA: hypothetical protein VHG35_08620 [Gemmatimonadales bacterium]|nr:hypothetical protein [Gemmatimonadales bacterium]
MSPPGITIHEPDVVLTDLGLAILGAWFAWRLAGPRGRGSLGLAPAVLMAGLASAAFWGAVFHGFFPRKTETLPGFIAWVPVSLSIVVAASALLDLGLRVLAPGLDERTRRRVAAAYAAAFAAVVLLVDESFGSIVRFYVPALLLFLIAATVRAIRDRGGWISIALGLGLSAVAALLQQLQVALHPVYFDHNAVYHVVQAAALVLLYAGFRRIADATAGR